MEETITLVTTRLDDESRKELAVMFRKLADGQSVELGDFSDQSQAQASNADLQAEFLREAADQLEEAAS